GESAVSTGIGFFDHMLCAFAKHGGFDLEMNVTGDLEVDFHHTIEDCGIALGSLFEKALGDKGGIERFGDVSVPLDEALSRVVVDISGRPFLHFGLEFPRPEDGSGVNPWLFEEFFRGFVNNAKITLHIDRIRGDNSHHILECTFKAFARAMKKAVSITGNTTDIPSTKGVL
ncbi:MAG: imidazoleglycerol-phosphate dehydratase HisB, partial [Spirochaetales bacterium]|nr:imidazoleglycerol-phosphate dehydratase HisB [Spirochaetales bacterium]